MGTERAAAAEASGSETADFATNVHPEIGTGWRGHMFPGAVAPFGLVQLSPDSSGLPGPPWNGHGTYEQWDHCSGYHHRDNVILGFSHTHVQGTGGIDLGDILLMPLVEGRNWSWDPGAPEVEGELQSEALGPDSGWVFGGQDSGYRSFFTHEEETARAGYYGVHLLTPDVHAELTATTRCGMHRYRFPSLPAQTRRGVILDLVHGLGNQVYQAELKIESATRISGMRATHGWAADRPVYFVLEFSQPFAAAEVQMDTMGGPAAAGDARSGKLIKAIFTHAPSAEPLVVRVGISATSVEGASKNLAAEVPRWDFDAVARAAEMEWNRALGVLEAELPNRELAETFYTGAYHGLVAPATFNDVDGTYRGQDRQNHSNPGFTKHTALSIWDIYRGEFPFIMLMQPQRTGDIVRTLLADYEQLGLQSLPMWPLWGFETWSMTGFHAAGMILGAYVRGFRDFDVEAAYTAIRNTALAPKETPSPGASAHNVQKWRDNGSVQELFRQHGYIPMELHGGSVSCTLDIAYDYWCAGAMAELLGKQDDAAMFYKLGQNYRNVFDPSTGFMRGKTAEGKWRDPFRPDQEYDDYVETDSWQASTSVPHDVQGLIELHGGDAAFIAKMDALFSAPSYVIDSRPDITGMVGQDAQGNEPSNHIAYLYPFAGAAWKTQQWVRKVAGLYNNTPAGIPGNDDCGQLSSWFAFAALGFYPVNAANGVYVIGSPLVNRVTIRNAKGKPFTIVAENNSAENVYIQRAELNGKELTRSWFRHEEIAAGGELRFRMGAQPNKEWATAPADRPPSGLVKG
ncbi:MAG TPA: GH92 family glycosyl hydrolase [Terracidiphilus sp.]|jgi:predicted alpha-1,2-mannosidase